MKTIGIFAGSFNPFHLGHLDILNQSKLIFDEVIVARGYNTGKDISSCYIKQCNYVKEEYVGLLTDYIDTIERLNPGTNVVLIRGIRNSIDLTYEQNMLFFLKELKSNLKTIFISCNPEFEYISSSAIRTLIPFNKHLKYIP